MGGHAGKGGGRFRLERHIHLPALLVQCLPVTQGEHALQALDFAHARRIDRVAQERAIRSGGLLVRFQRRREELLPVEEIQMLRQVAAVHPQLDVIARAPGRELGLGLLGQVRARLFQPLGHPLVNGWRSVLDRQAQRHLCIARDADLLAHQPARLGLQRHGLARLEVVGRGQRYRQQHGIFVDVFHEAAEIHRHRHRPLQRARLPALGQLPIEARGVAGGGAAPVGVPVVEVVELKRHGKGLARLDGFNLGDQARVDRIVVAQGRCGQATGEGQQKEDDGQGVLTPGHMGLGRLKKAIYSSSIAAGGSASVCAVWIPVHFH
ncbi:MAG: hypothetical protein E1N59_1063 [Puniceicoccaceae bacterium 5H]|nr:MAG: hypothetical protein E1N59_1063 [Puniceicoccaceae bacterium 5H]